MMSPNIFQKKWVIGLLLVILLSVMGVGCSTTVKERQQGQP